MQNLTLRNSFWYNEVYLILTEYFSKSRSNNLKDVKFFISITATAKKKTWINDTYTTLLKSFKPVS